MPSREKCLARIAAGVCTACGKNPLASKTRCDPCLLAGRGYNRRRYAKLHMKHKTRYRARIAEGMCGKCGQNPLFSTSRCIPCLEETRQGASRWRAAHPEKKQRSNERRLMVGGMYLGMIGFTEKERAALLNREEQHGTVV